MVLGKGVSGVSLSLSFTFFFEDFSGADLFAAAFLSADLFADDSFVFRLLDQVFFSQSAASLGSATLTALSTAVFAILSTMTFATFEITLNASAVPTGEVRHAVLLIKGKTIARFPITIVRS